MCVCGVCVVCGCVVCMCRCGVCMCGVNVCGVLCVCVGLCVVCICVRVWCVCVCVFVCVWCAECGLNELFVKRREDNFGMTQNFLAVQRNISRYAAAEPEA